MPHSSGVGHGRGFRYLGDLISRPDDPLALIILDGLRILALQLCPLPYLHLTSPSDDSHPHGGEKIVGGVGVHVHSPVEHGGGVFADAGPDHGLSSRVGCDEVGDIVDHPSDGDETSSVLGLVREIIPFDDRQGIQRNPPIQLGASLVEFLLHLLDLPLFNFVLLELLQVVGETQLLPNPDRPFRGVILVPFDGVAIIGREFMMKIMVSFAQSHQSRDDVIARGVSVIKWLIAEPVGQRIDAKGGLLDEKDPKDSSIDEATPPIPP